MSDKPRQPEAVEGVDSASSTTQSDSLQHLIELSPLLTEEQIIDHALAVLDQIQTISVKTNRRVGLVPLDMDGDVLAESVPLEIKPL